MMGRVVLGREIPVDAEPKANMELLLCPEARDRQITTKS